MNYVLFFGSLLLVMTLAWLPTPSDRPVAPWLYRIALLGGAGLTSAAWYGLYVHHWATPYAVLPAVIGAVVGALVTTGIDIGSVEYLAVPSSDTRTRVRTAHSVFQRYRCRTLPKWTLDTLGASVGLVLTLPLWPVIALLIWFEEPGPIFRAEYVVGKRGVTFRRCGFRTTRHGAERQTLTVGRFLRRWHLDALPALVNVLIGQMSLVGPVAQRTVLVQAHLSEIPGYSERHTVKPGMAGTAPGGDDPTPMERLDADRAYLRRMSFLVDLWLLTRAAWATLRGRRRPAPAASPESTDGRVIPTKRATNRPVPVHRDAWPVRFERRTRPGGRRTTSTVYRSATFSHALPTNRQD